MVIDFGTATTYDYISAKGVFEYTVISPGIEIAAQALWSMTAKLPEIEIIKPERVLSKNTVSECSRGWSMVILVRWNILCVGLKKS